MEIRKKFTHIKTIFFLVMIIQLPIIIFAQENKEPHFNRDSIITTANKMMEKAKYCALITLDNTGHPDARIMDPFSPNEDMVVWLGTNTNSRKVKQIKNDLRVTLYYQALNQTGYVIIKGQAYIVDDPIKKQTYWKKEWSSFYSEDKLNYTLIKVVPEKLEIIDYPHGITGDSKTWAVPFANFNPSKSN